MFFKYFIKLCILENSELRISCELIKPLKLRKLSEKFGNLKKMFQVSSGIGNHILLLRLFRRYSSFHVRKTGIDVLEITMKVGFYVLYYIPGIFGAVNTCFFFASNDPEARKVPLR